MTQMNGIQFNTDFSQIAPNAPAGQQFPATTDKLGWLVHIVESGPRETKKRDGMMAALKLEILDGPHKNFVGEYLINIANPNPQAASIGMAEMSAIAHVTGTLRVGNSQELHRKPFRILVRQQKDNPQYTEIYGVLDANGNEAGKAGQGPLQPGGGAFGQQGGGQQGFQPGGQQGQPGGGFQPGPGQQGGQPDNNGGQQWQPNQGGQQGQPGWGGGNGGGGQPDPNQGGQGGQPGWGGGQSAGGQQGGQPGNGGQPGWANNG